MYTVTCEPSMLRIPMGEDTLTLVRGDRLLISNIILKDQRVIAVNESNVEPFSINFGTIMEVQNASTERKE